MRGGDSYALGYALFPDDGENYRLSPVVHINLCTALIIRSGNKFDKSVFECELFDCGYGFSFRFGRI